MGEKTLLNKFLSSVKRGSLEITYWDGETKMFGTTSPKVQITIHDPSAIWDVVNKSTLGFGEAYMDGRIDVSSPLEMVSLFLDDIPSHPHYPPGWNVPKEQQVQFHYDKGNDFFSLWLDSTLSYSCAYFQKETDSIEKAQSQKTAYILKKLHLQESHSLLDIGCGWGHLLIAAAKHYGVTGLGITLSEKQYEYAKEIAKREGIEHRVKFQLMSFEDLKKNNDQFDRIVSIGMFEHVGRPNYSEYFHTLKSVLKKGGLGLLHTITQQKEQGSDPWLDTYIFPGGMIPSVREIVQLLPDFHFYLLDYENLRAHYALTLRRWQEKFDENKDRIEKKYGESFYRMWRLYLSTSLGGFQYGHLSLSQFTFSKEIDYSYPLTRDSLYA
ncbi:class I SAM-dependent methyltransferase [Candidatus Roizmanbacteria bacterium]|nr:class I SAM-dependent methyltransferase [Candidatus Roizmanbacteria bacterium]